MRQEELDRFYALLDIKRRICGPRALAHCSRADGWPERGVYFFFEPGETRADNSPRVVRVGTHAVSAGSKATLWSRLSQHRGNLGGKFPGAGNHRGSVLRLHVGTALLATGVWPESVQGSWLRERHEITSAERAAEIPLEVAISNYIGVMPCLWVEVDDAPGKDSNRALIEQGAIALLSNARGSQIDESSSAWIGRHAAAPEIRASGLWNVKHVHGAATTEFIGCLERYVVKE